MRKNFIKFKYFIININKNIKNIFIKSKPIFKFIWQFIKNAFVSIFMFIKNILVKFGKFIKNSLITTNKRIKNKKDLSNSKKYINKKKKTNKIYNKPKKRKKKKNKNNIGKKILNVIGKIIIIFICFIILCVIAFAIYIAINAPKFDPDNLTKNNGTLIYDRDGELITVIGTEKRQNVSYDDLPQVLIDAIISTEDANFFTHKGVDLKRLIKATYYQAKGDSSAGGASTITMQLSKNSFTSTEATGIKGIVRKMTDIYLSVFYIERKYSKEELMEFYVNSPYLGSSSYGVEQASQTYFNKHVGDLNLVESATIAGLIQAPSAYDPYLYPDKIEQRKNLVLSLMKKHGHITEEEYQEAKKITVKSLLVDQRKESTTKYQGFVDTVVQEVIDDTGDNPFQTPMAIYTTLDTSKQDIINDFYDSYDFKDKLVQAGVGVIDNSTGEILAVGAGRYKTKEMTYNFATQINRHPGSTAKPLFDYGPGIEYNKWSTAEPFTDKPTTYSSGVSLKNWDNKYMGYMTLKNALAESRNTCALQAFRKVDNKKIIEFVESLGIEPEVSDGYLGEWHAIGAFNGVNPIQLAGAYSAFGNKGVYHKPHSYTKIKYYETGKVKENKIKAVQAMSEETAYMISYILQEVTSSRISVKGTQIATKTGTSSYDEDLTDSLGLSSNIIQDSWTVTYSPDYTVSIWYGYNKLYQDHYNTMNEANIERINMQEKIVNKLMKKKSKFVMPVGCISKYYGGSKHIFWKSNPKVTTKIEDYVTSTKKTTKKKKTTSTTETNTNTTTTIPDTNTNTNTGGGTTGGGTTGGGTTNGGTTG